MEETINRKQRIKVYSWIGYWDDARNPNHHKQARYTIAANSKAQVMRIVGRKMLFNLSETGNQRTVPVAQADPLALFVEPLDNCHDPLVRVSVGDKGVRP